jgi:hypothetical protein
MAAGEKECWCLGATVSKDALGRLPAVARGKACVCERCASGAAARVESRAAGVEPDTSS